MTVGKLASVSTIPDKSKADTFTLKSPAAFADNPDPTLTPPNTDTVAVGNTY